MGRVLFGYPVFSDDSVLYQPSLSGGSWAGALPLTNLKTREQAVVARSSTDARADTQFTADLGVARAVRTIVLAGHNISGVLPTNAAYDGEVRVRGFTAPPLVDAGGDGYQPFASGWSAVGTPTRTPNAFMCSDGVYLDLIGDDTGASAEGYSRAVTFTGNGVKTLRFRMARSSAYNGHFIGIFDVTGGVYVGSVSIDYTTTTPSVVATTGTLLALTARGDGSYTVVVATSSVTATNSFELRVLPAAGASADTAAVYVGDVQVFNSATDALVYDSGITPALPTGTTAEDRDGWNPTYVHVTPSEQTARYWRVNVNDDNNPDGYVEIGRLLITGGIQPAINASVGCTLGWANDRTVRTETDGGATLFNTRRRRREATLLLEQQSDAEAHGALDTMKQRAGTSGQLVFVYDPDDTAALAWKRRFVAVLRELSPVQYPKPTFRATPIAVIEEL